MVRIERSDQLALRGLPRRQASLDARRSSFLGALDLRLHADQPVRFLGAAPHIRIDPLMSQFMKPAMNRVQHLRRSEVEQQQAPGEHERQRDEVDRNLRRQLVGEAEQQIDDDRRRS